MAVDQHRHSVRTVYETLEVAAWAPWLQFDLAQMEAHRLLFPEGQLVIDDDDGEPLGALTTLRMEWDGDPRSLTTWDEMSGGTTTPAEVHRGDGNTLLLLSSSVRVPSQGRGTGLRLIGSAQRVAARIGVDHIIGPGRPSGFGRHKAAGGSVDFDAYVNATRDDGLPADPWLRSLTRLGMRPLRTCELAMVVRAAWDDVERWRARHRPDRWFRLDDERAAHLLAELPTGLVGADVEVWECGETGSWFVDRPHGVAAYIEHNLWGTFPIRDADASLDDIDAVIDLTDTAAPKGPSVGLQTPRGATVLELSLFEDIRARAGDAEVAMAWLESADPRADVVRQLELEAFPTIAAFVRPELEAWCRFLVVIDMAPEWPQIGHGFRVSGYRYGPGGSPDIGMPTVDEIVAANDGITLEDVLAFYRSAGIVLRRNIAVESSFRIEGARRGIHDLRWSDFGYAELSREAKRDVGRGGEERGVFAHVNEATVRSMGQIGVTVQPFAGRRDLRSPASQPGTFDDAYAPAYITVGHRNGELLDALGELVPAALRLDLVEPESVIDLRDSVIGEEPASSDGARK